MVPFRDAAAKRQRKVVTRSAIGNLHDDLDKSRHEAERRPDV
jgi:hypothetical protein